ncbi:MAG: hypothetical protein HQ522_17535 [Bacteroidetes bacterium]|nr:hypothetical protein [Bacteroidota bacterium]
MKNLILVSCFIVLLTGCTHKVYLPLIPDYEMEVNSSDILKSIEPSMQFVKGSFEDKRSDITLFATFKQQVHTYNLFAERPVEDAIYDGIAVMFDKNGHSWSDSETGQIKINLKLLSATAARTTGMIKVGANSSIQINLEFVDNKSGNLIYSQEYNGTDERSQVMIGLMDMVKKSIDASIINCINNVANDKLLAESLTKYTN